MSSPRSVSGVAKKNRPLSEEALSLVARRFAVLGEPMRLRLLQALIDGEKPVNALAAAVGGTQANVSRHLQTLSEADLVGRRKEGLQVFYAIADPSIFELCELVCGSISRHVEKRAGAFR